MAHPAYPVDPPLLVLVVAGRDDHDTVPVRGHGRRQAAEDVAEAAGLAPRRHLGADEDDVHAGAGAHDERREPGPAARLLLLVLVPGRRARAGPHAERVRRRRRPGPPQALRGAAAERGRVRDAQAGARCDELRRGQSRHAD